MMVPTSVGNSQYFLESLTQAVLAYAVQATGVNGVDDLVIYTGGDGRLPNSYAMEVLIRVAAGHGVGTVRLADRGVLTTAEAVAALEGRKSTKKAAVAFGV